ncbi:MAG: YgiQ family radical SAM protein [Clostridia bacterium]|nr:YgiQ family radical SAM protein [Clostridia bacterium]
MNNSFLPTTKEEMTERGWDSVDFVYVSGDAYVDHPSFGASIITRVLENEGFRVAFLSQPNWNTNADFIQFGKPELGFLVSSGNIDSMVAHYTAAKKKRSEDAYTPGGIAGKRPDYAVEVYCRKIRETYPDIPIIIGGLEASLRRFAHYDYWKDQVLPSILVSSTADILSYGMGEHSIVEIAVRLRNGEAVHTIRDVRGTCYLCPTSETPYIGAECPSYDNVCNNEKEYAIAARIQQDEQDHVRGKLIKQKHGKMMLVQNPPALPLTTQEMDEVYALPYMRAWHPSYDALGGVPGFQEVQFSVTHNRGCFGGCNFCSLAFHQGRFISTRSHKSVLSEIELLTKQNGFKGYVHDIGGPTANFRQPSCELQIEKGLCKGKKCLAPTPCPNLKADHGDYLDLLEKARKIPGVKKIFIRSGIRFDYLMADRDDRFFKTLVEHHVSGQLKVAPEHICDSVLDKMGKPHSDVFKAFAKKYFRLTAQVGKEQYLVPYLMSSHPGCTLQDAVELALFLKKERMRPEQVQDFYPTPGTISTAMFYTELDPYTLEKVYVAKDAHDKALQRALLNYWVPEKRMLVLEALKKAGRLDLIGNAPNCLVADVHHRTDSRGATQGTNRKPSKKVNQYAPKKKKR